MSENPYAAPQSDVIEASGNTRIHIFKRFSAWWVFILNLVTMGIYPLYWMYNRASIINNHHDKKIENVYLFLKNFCFDI